VASSAPFLTTGTLYGYVAGGDVNGDGYSDLVVSTIATSVTPHVDTITVFLGSATGISATNVQAVTSAIADPINLGALATAGDVNGDGYADVILGHPNYLANTGAAEVFYGGAAGLSATPTTLVPPLSATSIGESYLGNLAATVGDVDGDGYDDVAVLGSATNNGSVALSNVIYVFHGASAGITTTPQSTLTFDTNTGGDYTKAVQVSLAAGDVNGDGYSDLAYSNGAGSAASEPTGAIYFGSASGLPTTVGASLGVPVAGALNWWIDGIAGLGDVNGDGYADIGIQQRWEDSTGGMHDIFLQFAGGTSASLTAQVTLDNVYCWVLQ
jgi:hypothetical protein